MSGLLPQTMLVLAVATTMVLAGLQKRRLEHRPAPRHRLPRRRVRRRRR